ncbi:EamA family transporter, partial [Natronococcus sp. JC468]|uniref:EamA family transporter n=1 Tax=Natronococcus sp. JC468 TaxID=1961921 RepID=UPI001FD7ABE4
MIRRALFRSGYGDLVLFSILALCWGTSFVAIEVGLEYVPPLLFAGLRYGVAGLIVLGYAAVATDRLRPVDRTEWLSVGVAGVFLIAFYRRFEASASGLDPEGEADSGRP